MSKDVKKVSQNFKGLFTIHVVAKKRIYKKDILQIEGVPFDVVVVSTQNKIGSIIIKVKKQAIK